MQIVGEADQLYGVAHTNRVSNVYAIRREDALTFLQVSTCCECKLWLVRCTSMRREGTCM